MDSNKNNITLKSLAEELNLSVSTVSKAINNSPLVLDKTKKLVLDKAREYNYYPNIMARSLRTKGAKTIGVILNDFENPIHLNVIDKVSKNLFKYDYTTLLFNSQYKIDIEKKNILALLSRIPDCVIISPVNSKSDNILLFKDLLSNTIILDNNFTGVKANYININHKRGGYIAAKTLLESGHVKNMIFTAPSTYWGSVQYLGGIKEAYAEHGISFDGKKVIECFPSYKSGYKNMLSLLKENNGNINDTFTGVMAFCDMMAFGIIKACKKTGYKIPDDISIIGYDDILLSSNCSPALTTTHLPINRIASLCIEILYSKLIDNDKDLKTYILEPYIVNRDTIKKII